MLLVANLPNTKWCKKSEKWPKPWQMGTHLRVLSESFPMNTNMTGFGWFSLPAFQQFNILKFKCWPFISLSSIGTTDLQWYNTFSYSISTFGIILSTSTNPLQELPSDITHTHTHTEQSTSKTLFKSRKSLRDFYIGRSSSSAYIYCNNVSLYARF